MHMLNFFIFVISSVQQNRFLNSDYHFRGHRHYWPPGIPTTNWLFYRFPIDFDFVRIYVVILVLV